MKHFTLLLGLFLLSACSSEPAPPAAPEPVQQQPEEVITFENSDYSIRNGEAYFGEDKVEGADTESFEVFEGVFGVAKDKNFVYFVGLIMPNSQPTETIPLGGIYFADEDGVFFSREETGVQKIKGARTDDFEVLDYYYAKSQDAVYWDGKEVEDADPESFQTLTEREYWDMIDAEDKNAYYLRGEQTKKTIFSLFTGEHPPYLLSDKSFVYLQTEDGEEEIVSEIDLKTFEVVGGLFLRDMNGIWYVDPKTSSISRIPGVDTEYFRLFDPEMDGAVYSSYFTDEKHIFYKTQMVKEADMDSFQYFGKGYAWDKNAIYDNGKEKTVLNTEDFSEYRTDFFLESIAHKTNLQLQYADDLYDILLCDNDGVRTFCYLRNGDKVYKGFVGNTKNEMEKVLKVDGITFEKLISGYAKDKDHVYLLEKGTGDISVVENADPKTFEIVRDSDSYDAQDKNHKYLRGEIVEILPEDFSLSPGLFFPVSDEATTNNPKPTLIAKISQEEAILLFREKSIKAF